MDDANPAGRSPSGEAPAPRRGEPRRATRDDLLLAALVSGLNVDAASQEAKMGRRTAFRRLQDPAFQQRLRAARQEVFGRAAARAASHLGAAVDVLADLMRGASSEQVKRGAAADLAQVADRLNAMTALDERLAALEGAVSELAARSFTHPLNYPRSIA